MEAFEYILEKFHIITILSWFLSVFSLIQLYYNIKSCMVQWKFFKHHATKEKIHDRTNTVLLKYSLDIICSLDNKIESWAVPLLGTVAFMLGLYFFSESIMQIVSFAIAFISFVAWILTSRWNNRIVKQIDAAKPTVRQ